MPGYSDNLQAKISRYGYRWTVDVDIDQLAEDAVKELDWTKIEVEELE